MLQFTKAIRVTLIALVVFVSYGVAKAQTGACCFIVGACSNLIDQVDCLAMNGTPQGPASICVDGCSYLPASGDVDGNGDVDLLDYLDWPRCAQGPAQSPLFNDCTNIDLNGNGFVDQLDFQQFQIKFTGTTIIVDPPDAICGNDIVEIGEQCDPPNGTTCDVNCQITTGGVLKNDSCLTPIYIGEGDRSFTTTGATTDGPDETDSPSACILGSYTHVESDIWYLYTSTCPNLAIVSLCGSLYDTKMMIYEGSACPVMADLPWACSDDDCGAGANSRAIFTATIGQQYVIRIGGFQGEQGDGTLTIYCGNDPSRGLAACGAGAGECLVANNSPGCNDVNTCNQVCEIDPFCCDTMWDQTCAAKADGIVNGFPACIGSTNACDVEAASGTGCSDQTCCQAVCKEDAFCCTTRWDAVCADRANSICP